MNEKTLLQIPMTRTLKNDAEKISKELGFSSLQETVRLFLSQFVAKKVKLTFTSDVLLSSEEETILNVIYKNAKKEIKEGKGHTATSAEELLEQLRS